MSDLSDTIAAIATAAGEAGIAVVRISGPRSLDIADVIFRGKAPPPSKRPGRTFVHGRIQTGGDGADGGETAEVDEVILLIYRAPHSYTREDVVEIQGHGGRTCARRILRAVVAAGARLAEPGEFTRRAFTNGRIDLAQAEAVLDLIRASSDRAARAAIEQLEGSLSTCIAKCYDDILESTAALEATLDFPDDDMPEAIIAGVPGRLNKARESLCRLLATWQEGHLLREGAVVVISGRPNAGKSTLLNRLLGKDRSIVTAVPGTTRDTIEEQIIIEGVPVRIVDTAGLRDADGLAEREGVDRARKAISAADANLYVVDVSVQTDEGDAENLKGLPRDRCIVILNKQDLGTKVTPSDFQNFRCIECSLLDSGSVDEIRRAILDQLQFDPVTTPHSVISERHYGLLHDALRDLDDAIIQITSGIGDCVAISASHLRRSLENIGKVTGRVYDSELLDSIFSQFCIGK